MAYCLGKAYTLSSVGSICHCRPCSRVLIKQRSRKKQEKITHQSTHSSLFSFHAYLLLHKSQAHKNESESK